MWKYLKRRWKYLTAKLTGRFEESADPKVQLQQAIAEANEQHRRLKEQAANVIANQKQTEMRLNRAIEELEKVNGNARQAIMMAEQEAEAGHEAKAISYTQAAEQFAGRLISLEQEIESMKSLYFQSTEAADQAKAAVSQNAMAVQKKLGEQQKLLGQLDQARMQEQINEAMTTLSESVGDDVPTFNEVRDKIEARYAKAKGTAELTEGNIEASMLEIEAAARNNEAKARLAEIKEQIGIEAESSAPEITGGE